jgi:hypothetical protein
VSDLRLDPGPLPDGLGIPAADGHQTPTSVRQQFLSLLKRVEALEACMPRDSSTSSRPPSTDAPARKRQRRMHAAERRLPGGTLGHPGHPQVLWEPTATVSLRPEGGACGHCGLVERRPYRTHQVIELPVMRPEVTHWLLPRGGAGRVARCAKHPCLQSRGAGMGHG